MLKKIITIFGILVFGGMVFLLSSTKTFAQSKPVSNTSQTVIVADVNIYDAKIISQNSNSLVIGFDIFNRTGIQPNVRYGIQLIKIEDQNGTKVTADTYIYPEIVNLGENITVHKQISYNIPSGLRGKYEVWVISRNSSGLMLGLSQAGKITLAGNFTATIEILSETCSLVVQGNKDGTKYSLQQGVDINTEESLEISCTIRSSFDKAISIIPKFETFYRTVFGNKVEQIGGATSSVVLKGGNNSSISFILPKAQTPQAYDIKFNLATADEKTVSNTVIAHYVLQGASATIQNITLDKDLYFKGDTAKLMVYWSGSADGFQNSRVGTSTAIELPRFDIHINNSENELCGELSSYQPSALVDKDVTVQIQQDCISPQVTFTLSSKSIKDGVPLFVQSDFKITTDESRLQQPRISAGRVALYILIFLSVILIVANILFVRKKKIGTSLPLNLFLIILGVNILIALPDQAEALTLTYSIPRGGYDDPTKPNFTIGLDKSSYRPGEVITVNISADDAVCSNYNVSLRTYGRIDDRNYNATLKSLNIDRTNFPDYAYYDNIDIYSKVLFNTYHDSVTISGVTFVAPQASGMHTLWITNLYGSEWSTDPILLKYFYTQGAAIWSRLGKDEEGNDPDNTGIYGIPFEVIGSYIDIGLRVYNGSQTVKIAAEAGVATSPLRVAKNGTVYGIPLVDPADTTNSSGVLIKLFDSTKALRKYTGI